VEPQKEEVMKTQAFLVHALSPLHAGTGQALDVVDLPIARMKATGIPYVPGSSIKGVLRDVRKSAAGNDERALAVFGPEAPNAADHAGALVVGDARLLALPVRSFRGVFAWVTSPLLLTLAKRDFEGLGNLPSVPSIQGRGARVSGNCCLYQNRLYLEDIDLDVHQSPDVDHWAKWLAPYVVDGDDYFSKRLVVVDDETMTFLCETATQVDARVRLVPETGTAASGALWYEESLPPETLLIGLLVGDRSRRKSAPMTSDEVLRFALNNKEVLQLGGKASTGRGRCRVIPVVPQAEAKDAGK
jgi:CRISPR-associated protein Cmr4